MTRSTTVILIALNDEPTHRRNVGITFPCDITPDELQRAIEGWKREVLGDYRNAIGCAPAKPSSISAEEAVRKIRGGE